MAITMNELIDRIKGKEEIYLLVCGEAVVFDREKTLTYVPKSNFDSAVMNSLADFKTMLGHALLWSQQEVVDITSADMMRTREDAGFRLDGAHERQGGWIARLVSPAAHD